MPNQVGKRYTCEVCGTQILCTKPGTGTFTCCDKPLDVQQPKTLPSAD